MTLDVFDQYPSRVIITCESQHGFTSLLHMPAQAVMKLSIGRDMIELKRAQHVQFDPKRRG
jgi:hypothetical protein